MESSFQYKSVAKEEKDIDNYQKKRNNLSESFEEI